MHTSKDPGVVSSKQSVKVFPRPYVLWDCKVLLSCTCRGGWPSHRNIEFTNTLPQLEFFFFLMGGHYSEHSPWISTPLCPSRSRNNTTPTQRLYRKAYVHLCGVSASIRWICFGLWLWEVSVCPCWRMFKGCSKLCPCACVGVGVINAQQAGGETDGEVCLWMLGLFQSTFVRIHATPSSTQYYE